MNKYDYKNYFVLISNEHVVRIQNLKRIICILHTTIKCYYFKDFNTICINCISTMNLLTSYYYGKLVLIKNLKIILK